MSLSTLCLSLLLALGHPADQAPVATLYLPLRAAGQPGVLKMEWKAESTDPKATIRSVSLQWAEAPRGPWHPIGPSAMANTGDYLWRVPSGVPTKVYLRLTVRDSAGRKAVAETPVPFTLPLRR